MDHGARRAARALCLAAAVLAAGALPACNNDPEHRGPRGLPTTLWGTVQTGPHLAGEWSASTTVGVDGCGIAALPLRDAYIVRIDPSGASLGGEVLSACGEDVAPVEGTSSFDGTVTLDFDESLAVGGACVLRLHHSWTGALQSDLRTLSGTRTLHIEAEGDCGKAYPCDVTGTFAASLCDRGVCPRETCGS